MIELKDKLLLMSDVYNQYMLVRDSHLKINKKMNVEEIEIVLLFYYFVNENFYEKIYYQIKIEDALFFDSKLNQLKQCFGLSSKTYLMKYIYVNNALILIGFIKYIKTYFSFFIIQMKNLDMFLGVKDRLINWVGSSININIHALNIYIIKKNINFEQSENLYLNLCEFINNHFSQLYLNNKMLLLGYRPINVILNNEPLDIEIIFYWKDIHGKEFDLKKIYLSRYFILQIKYFLYNKNSMEKIN